MAFRSSALAFLPAAALWLAAPSYAVPLYYSFAGKVTYSAAAGYAPGQDVTYVFRVDRDGQGVTLDAVGNPQAMDDTEEGPDFFTDFFAAEYLGGSALPFDNPASEIKESSRYGMDLVHPDEIFSALRGSNADLAGFDLLDIWSADTRFGDWKPGQALLAENFVGNGPGQENSDYSASLVLASIDAQDPRGTPAVPEPASYALFALGLIGLCLSLRGSRSRVP